MAGLLCGLRVFGPALWRTWSFNPRPFGPDEAELSNKDRVVILAGGKDIGKGTFIRNLLGKAKAPSFTLRDEPSPVRLFLHRLGDGQRLILLDIPDFYNSEGTDTGMLLTVASWLAATYNIGVVPCGILFFRSINDSNTSGATEKQVALFQTLCGEKYMKNIIFVTTKWEAVDPATGAEREQTLRKSNLFWRTLLDGEAQVARFRNDDGSALQVIQMLDGRAPIPLRIQRELVGPKFKLRPNSMGRSNVSADDSVVLVMGPTGAGKSSFIKMVTQRDDIEVAQTMSPCTRDVGVFPCDDTKLRLNGKRLVLVDTPGFCDDVQPGESVAGEQSRKVISSWLKNSSKLNVVPAGILLLQNIDQPLESGTTIRQYRMLRELLRDQNMKSVVIVTTMWGQVGPRTDVGKPVEQYLRKEPFLWGHILEQGGRVTEYDDTRDSACRVIWQIEGK